MSSLSSVVVDEQARPLPQPEPPLRAVSGASVPSRLQAAALFAVALIPAAWMLYFAHSTARNIPYFDEIDTAIALLLQLDAGPPLTDLLNQLVAVNNEHRMFTSRLMFVLSYVFTGSVNFVWIAAIGNSFVVAAGLLLLRGVTDRLARLTLAVVLAFSLFHFGHYENFLWSGASIDHFQVIALAFGAFVALQRPSRTRIAAAILCALLATFTLAHGLVTWPVGGIFLLRERRWRDVATWSVVALIAVALFLAGFHVNPGHRVGDAGIASLPQIIGYWCNVLGAPLAFGHVRAAKLLGALLFVIVLFWSVGNWTRRREILPALWFVLGSTLLIALGRAAVSDDGVASRYLVLGAAAWSIVVADLLRGAAYRPITVLACAVPLLAAFNIAQNRHYRADALTFLEHRDRAALRFRQYGEDGRAPVTLHPLPKHATRLLKEAEQRGVYRIPPLCELREFADASASDQINYYVDEFSVDQDAVFITGWATVPHRAIERGEIHFILRSPDTSYTFTTVPLRRPDVVRAYNNPGWEFAGFRAVIRRDRIAPGDYQVGFLMSGDNPAAFTLSDHRLHLNDRESRVTFKK